MDPDNDDAEILPYEEPSLDQSNGPSEAENDLQTRAYALEFAQRANQVQNGHPSWVMPVARDVYLFITGRDPVVDVAQNAGPNVIAMADHRIDYTEDEDDDHRNE